jgi:hypothetical protein
MSVDFHQITWCYITEDRNSRWFSLCLLNNNRSALIASLSSLLDFIRSWFSICSLLCLLSAYCWFLALITRKPWRWRQCCSPKFQWTFIRLYRTTSQKIILFMFSLLIGRYDWRYIIFGISHLILRMRCVRRLDVVNYKKPRRWLRHYSCAHLDGLILKPGSPCMWALYYGCLSKGNIPWYSLNRSLVRSQSGSKHGGEEKPQWVTQSPC